MIRRFRGSLFGCVIAVFIIFTAVLPALAAQSTVQLQRHIQTERLAPGETTVIALQLSNTGDEPINFNLIEEIGPQLELLATDGTYNKHAEFIVWRGTLAGGETTTVSYEARLLDVRIAALPLYAYVGTSTGETADDSAVLHAVRVPLQVSLTPTSVVLPDAAVMRFRVDNPFDRSLTVDLDVLAPDGITLLDANVGSRVTLEPNDSYEAATAIHTAVDGRFPITVIPRVAGVAAGDPKQTTLTVYENKSAADEDAAARVVAPVVHGTVSTPGDAVRTHRLQFPPAAVAAGHPLVIVAPLPPLAVYVPGTALINDRPVADAVARDEHLLFYIQPEKTGSPLPTDISLSYKLRYADREAIAANVVTDNDRLGVISLGPLPQLLRGTDELLTVLNTPPRRETPARVGAAILYPFDGQVFSDSDQTNVEVDAPAGATVHLTLNGNQVDAGRIGGISEDAGLDRVARQYVAVALQPGENHLTATAVTADGEQLTHRITVSRAGPPTTISIEPVTDLATGRIHPLVFQIAAADDNGLPPADGTEATVKVDGGSIISDDARPDWLGHQTLLYGGRAFVAIAPPAEATELVFNVQVGQAEQKARYTVTNQADEWFVIGQAGIKIDGIAGGDSMQMHPTARLAAQGPMPYDSVLTLAVNNNGLGQATSTDDLWTGDTSQSGALGAGSGPIFARWERELSFAQYGLNNISLDGNLGQYDNSLRGLHVAWNDTPDLSVQAFVAGDTADTVEELIAGDGTGYYRLDGRQIAPFTEDIAIVVRDHRFPHDIVRVMRLQPTRYFLDYETGQLVLAEPLPSTDENGNQVSLRVRYRLSGKATMVPVGGVQATYDTEQWLLRGTAYNRATDVGTTVQYVGFDGEARFGNMTLQADAARTWGSTAGNALSLALRHADVYGWTLLAQHRRLDPHFAGSAAATGITTSVSADRVLDGGVSVTTGAAVSRAHAAAPWTREASVGARWLAGQLRPQAGLKVTDGEHKAVAVSGQAGIAADIPQGSISYVREQPLYGTAPISDTVEARYELSRHHILQVSHQARRAGWNEPLTNNLGIALTQSLQGERLQTQVRGAYELPGGQSLAEGNLAFGVAGSYTLNERSKLSLTLDHRRPLVSTQPSGFGSTLGWKYRHVTGGESEWRFDMHWQGAAPKYALHWQGLHPINDAFTVRGNAMFAADKTGEQRLRLSGGAAYRLARTVFLGHVLRDQTWDGHDSATDTEWRLQAGVPLEDHWIANAGYARQTAGVNTATDKWNVGTRYSIRPKLDLLAEASLLRQVETNSSRTGIMAGIGYEWLDNLWVTAGYGSDGFVGHDSSGDRFSHSRAGLFVQLDWTFDEWTLRNLLGNDETHN